ncbi:MAG: hypothetical protein ACHQUC_05240 [Chlamydiales bacterium]
MELDPTSNWESLGSMKEHFHELKSQIQQGINQDPDYQGEADEILDSIDNLLEEIAKVKTPKDLTPKQQLKINALHFWISYILFQDEDEFEDEFEDDEEDLEEDNFFPPYFLDGFFNGEDKKEDILEVKPIPVKKLAGNQKAKQPPAKEKKIEKKAAPVKKKPKKK